MNWRDTIGANRARERLAQRPYAPDELPSVKPLLLCANQAEYTAEVRKAMEIQREAQEWVDRVLREFFDPKAVAAGAEPSFFSAPVWWSGCLSR